MAFVQLQDKRARWALVGLGVLLFLVFYIDDWGRDFTTNEAELTAEEFDPRLQQLIQGRSVPELAAGIRMASRRIGNWSYVGEADYDDATQVEFVRTARLLRVKDDISIRVRDDDGRRTIEGESRSRIGFADLGVNPRNLRRLFIELHTVLEGADSRPVLDHPLAPHESGAGS